MQVKSVRMRYMWWCLSGLFLATALILGCESRDVVIGAPPTEVVEKIPDRSEATSRGQANLYGLGNPFVTSTVSRLIERHAVADAIVRLEMLGLTLDPGGSFVLEWIDEDGVVTGTFISATAGPPGSESATIACIERDGEISIAPAIFSSSPTHNSGEYRKLADDLWMNPVPFGPKSRSSQDTARFDDKFWNDFWSCIVIHIPAEAGACAVACTLFIPGYMHCVVSCVSAQALTTTVRCLFVSAMAQQSGNKDKNVD